MLEYLDKEKPALWFFEWRDHTVNRDVGWIGADEPFITPSTVLSVGWVLAEDDESVYVASHLDPDDGIHQGAFCIIKVCIVNAVKMETPEDAVHFPRETPGD